MAALPRPSWPWNGECQTPGWPPNRGCAHTQPLFLPPTQAHDRYVPSRGSEPPPRAGSASHRPNDDSADVVHPTRPAKSLLTDKCRETLGELFPPVYAYLKKARGEAVPEDKVRKHLSGLVGRERLNDCFCVDQLVFTEEMMN